MKVSVGTRSRSARVVAGVMAMGMLLAACSSSSKSSSGALNGKPTYNIGVLTALTGVASASNKHLLPALKAGAALAASEGYNIKYTVVDDTSTPAGALAGAQQLVRVDHVFAVIAISDLTFAAAPFLAQQGIPVIGGEVDASEWNTDRNMFSIFGYPDYSKVISTSGNFFKLVGATDLGTIGYGIVPSAALSTKGTAISAQVAGLKAGYVNAQFPLGSTNVGPVVLQMKSAGIDSVEILLQQNTAFDILNGLRDQGVTLKAPVLTDGFGQALLDAGPTAVQDAQNVYFTLTWEPVEMHTAATQKLQGFFQGAGYTGIPALPEYLAYISFDALAQGLKAAGPNPTRASLINAMLGITNYRAAGLFGGHTVSFAMDQRGKGGAGADGCAWYTIFKGNSFDLVPGADPICGSVIPGKTVAGS
jgi:branched-chain amino acid transport system substrate-binding protein